MEELMFAWKGPFLPPIRAKDSLGANQGWEILESTISLLCSGNNPLQVLGGGEENSSRKIL